MVAAVGLLVAAILTTALWPHGRTLPPPRARVYRDVTACLLTGPQGVADAQTAAVWAGMQDASLDTKAQVSYLSVTGPETTATAVPYANTLIRRKCALILAIGPAVATAVSQVATTHPNQRFILIGSGTATKNTTLLPLGAPDKIRTAVHDIVKHDMG